MARYTGPKTKIARKFGEPIFGDDKSFEKRNYPPGQHGNNKRRSRSRSTRRDRRKNKEVIHFFKIIILSSDKMIEILKEILNELEIDLACHI